MVDALDEARFLWRLFDLNNSPNAGMEAYEDGQLVKRYGAAIPRPADFSVCVTPIADWRAADPDGRGDVDDRKRNRRR